MTTKEHRTRVISEWIEKLMANVAGTYTLSKSADEINALLPKLTASQLKAINSLIAASYATGCHETRTHIASLRTETKEFNKQKGDN